MALRSAIKTIATVAATIFVTPFLQAPASKLAESVGFDKVLSTNWGPTMSWLSSTAALLSQSQLYIFSAGALCATAVTLWLDVRFKSNGRPSPAPLAVSLPQAAMASSPIDDEILSFMRLCEGKTQLHADALVAPFVGRNITVIGKVVDVNEYWGGSIRVVLDNDRYIISATFTIDDATAISLAPIGTIATINGTVKTVTSRTVWIERSKLVAMG